MSSPTLTQLLQFAHAQQASDLHLSANQIPMMRVHGQMQPFNLPALSDVQVHQLIESVMTDAQKQQWQQQLELDFAITIPQLARFRVNAFYQNHGAAAVFRCIPEHIPSLHSLNLPAIFGALSQMTQGLILITGATGSGKSTTLAAIIDHINRTRACHILTIEDPIEFVHNSQKSLINQRQLHQHTHSFEQALRSALREDPDVILIGELRDMATIRLALTAAETGHLVLATLHTNSAAKSIHRLVDVFDAAEKSLVRTMLADTLQAVIAQKLLPACDGGRVGVFEIMLATPAVRNLIREDKIAHIPSAIQTGSASGMLTFEHSAKLLLQQGKIDAKTLHTFVTNL